MPLTKGCTRKTIQKNTKLMLSEGRSAEQSNAIAMDTARRACGLYLFCYGSNNARQLTERLGRVVCVKPGVLLNRKRVFRGKSLRWKGGVASLAPTKGSKVFGLLVEVDKEDLKKLDVIEGIASGVYVRRSVQAYLVIDAAKNLWKEVTAWAYVATSKEYHEPSKAYLEEVAKTVGEFWLDHGKKVTWKSFPIE